MTELTFFIVIAMGVALIRLFSRLKDSESQIRDLTNRLHNIEAEQRRERYPSAAAERAASATPPPARTVPAPVAPIVEPVEAKPPPLPAMAAKIEPIRVSPPQEPIRPKPEPILSKTEPALPKAAFAAAPPPTLPPTPPTIPPPPPTPPGPPRPTPEPPREPVLPEINFEAFMGVKLFAWLGGLALFLGIIFFVRYAFEHNLVSEQLRVALGALTGLGLVVGGLFIPRPKYAVTAQTLCSTGIVVLYGVTYSAYALYHFMSVATAFGIMATITAGAFVLAVRLDAQVVAILGLLAGFLTPIILSTGKDNAVALFTYLAVLDAGLIAVALRQQWRHLILLAAVATGLMQAGWYSHFFQPEKLGIATTVFLGFQVLFILPFWFDRRDTGKDEVKWTALSALLMGFAVLGFTGGLLDWQALGARPLVIFAIVLLADLGVVAVSLRQRWPAAIPVIAFATALLEAVWVVRYFAPSGIGAATFVFLGFEVLFILPSCFYRRDDASGDINWIAFGGLIMGGTALGYSAALLGWPVLGAQPLLIFGIVLLADFGLVAVGLRQRWPLVVPAVAFVTALLQIAWYTGYFAPAGVGHATLVFLGFEALFLLLFWFRSNKKETSEPWSAIAALMMGATALGYSAALLGWPVLGAQPLLAFGIVLLAGLGLVAVGLRQHWLFVVPAVAFVTALLEIAWYARFFAPAGVGHATLVFLGFEALFLLPFWFLNREDRGESWTTVAAGIMAATGLGYAAALLAWPELGSKPWICLSILMLADAGLVVWPLRRTVLQLVPIFGGIFVFIVLGVWNVRYLTDHLLGWALGFFILFAAFHTLIPIVLRRLRPSAATPRWAQAFPTLALVLMLWPALEVGASTALWAAILLADLTAIALALFTASILGVVAALILTLAAIALWLVQTPVDHPAMAGLLIVIAGFTVLFCGASVFLQRRLASSSLASSASQSERDALQHLPSISAVLPFLLLVAVIERLHPLNPSPVFGVGLFLVVMLLALARWSDTLALPPIALGCGVVLEYAWHAQNWILSSSVAGPASVLEEASRPLGVTPHGGIALVWYLAFAAAIAAFPFVFQSRARLRIIPWATAALAPVVHYPLIRDAAAHAWTFLGATAPGLIPAALAVPALAACEYLRRTFPRDNPARLGVLAWFGGVALFFITLIFPAQFDREWLTISWALEGAALCWLFHRLPHPGLRLVGFGLLVIAFVRLSINPNVLAYHDRSGTPIWNWYLYTYGLTAAAIFAGGFLLKPPRDKIAEINVCTTLFTFGTILLFLLLNIEIADFFATGPNLTFDFSGNLARDMTYSIAWALFALGLILAGMNRQLAPVRYAGIGLFVITLAKLFLHDLASLNQLYRIGAFIAVAILLIGASYLYQRFLAEDEKPDEQSKQS